MTEIASGKHGVRRQTGYAEPIFKVITSKDAVYDDFRRSVSAVAGTQLFVFGTEIENVEKFNYSVEFDGADSLIRTTITMTIFGSQVATELKED